jgi:hypothetical protein
MSQTELGVFPAPALSGAYVPMRPFDEKAKMGDNMVKDAPQY